MNFFYVSYTKTTSVKIFYLKSIINIYNGTAFTNEKKSLYKKECK